MNLPVKYTHSQPCFILITGPNAAGKTAFIEQNKIHLSNFVIIIPDDNRKGWREQVAVAADSKANIILESPWNSETITEIVSSRKREGYQICMYQLYLNSVDDSWKRVLQRNHIIERQLDKEMVKSNFNLNFRNVFSNFFFFDFAYFINSTTETKGLKAAFAKGMLVYFKSNDDVLLKVLRETAFKRGYLNAEANDTMIVNENFQNPLFNWPGLDIEI